MPPTAYRTKEKWLINRSDTRSNLAHVYWIAGSGCAGKSKVADLIADEYGLGVYHQDEQLHRHLEQATAEHQPAMNRLRDVGFERMFSLAPSEFASASVRFSGESLKMIIDDLMALPGDPMIVEGANLMPEHLLEISGSERIVYLIAFEEFQRAHYMGRAFIREWYQGFSDPDGVFENHMRCNSAMADLLYADAAETDLKAIVVDGQRTIGENAASVSAYFGFRSSWEPE